MGNLSFKRFKKISLTFGLTPNQSDMNKFYNKWIMYHEIQQRKREGMRPSQIASLLVMDTRTVKKYLAMSEQEYISFQQKLSNRMRKLTSYEDFVKRRIELCPEASSAQVHDWLKEIYPEFKYVSIKTVYNFVLYVRSKYHLLKVFSSREFIQVQELLYGKQAQVDFGEYNMTDADGKRKKVYFFAMVLSRSRYKFTIFSDHPFTAASAIEAHEKAFRFFGGYPGELVYDQDKVLLVDENKGNLILTEAFRSYHSSCPFKLRFCRKSDPQSKGKVENVIKYIKYNFLRGRSYFNIPVLNTQGLEWLDRTANAKIHSTTQKIPAMEWAQEKEHLIPLNQLFSIAPVTTTYNVRKDNVIYYKGSSYSLPQGTFQEPKTEVIVHQQENKLIICNINGVEIVRHEVSLIKGAQVRNNNHYRDHSNGVKELIRQVALLFTDQQKATGYLENIHVQAPRYARDQINIVAVTGKKYPKEQMDSALEYCLKNNIPKAVDFEPVMVNLNMQQGCTPPVVAKKEKQLQNKKYKINPNTSSINDYKQILK
jgi:transposase